MTVKADQSINVPLFIRQSPRLHHNKTRNRL